MDLPAVESLFQATLGRPVDLVVTENRSTVLRSIPKGGRRCVVRLHRVFLDAPREVLEAAAAWLRSGGRRRGSVIDRFVDAHFPARTPERPPASAARGAVHDLRAIYERLNAAHFENALDAGLAWARPGRTRSPRSIKFGSYDAASRTIRVHPVLDRPFVPEGFVAYILFHEMLHVALPPVRGRKGARRHHHAAFRARERAYPGHARWAKWEKANLRLLLREARPSALKNARAAAPAGSLPAPRRTLAQLLFGFAAP